MFCEPYWKYFLIPNIIKSRFHKVAAINIRNKKKEIIGIFLASLEVFRRIGEVFNLYVSQLTNPH